MEIVKDARLEYIRHIDRLFCIDTIFNLVGCIPVMEMEADIHTHKNNNKQ